MCLLAAAFLGYGQQVEHGVGAAAHGDVERHGVEESLTCGDAAWQYRLVAVLVVGVSVLHNLSGSCFEQLDAVLVGGQDGSVTGQSQTDGFGERGHRVGSEHA